MHITEREVARAFQLVQTNVSAVAQICYSAPNEDAQCQALMQHFGVTAEQANIMASFPFKYLSKTHRRHIVQTLGSAVGVAASQPEDAISA